MTLQDLLGGLPADSTLGDLRLDLLDIDVETVAGLVGTLLATAPEITLGDLRFDLMSGTNGLLLGALLSHLVGGALDDLLLGDIGTYTTDSGRDITLGDLGTWTLPTGADITLGDLAAYLPESITLADVLLGLIPASAFPYENFPFSALGLDVPGRLTIGPDFQDGVTGSSATLKPHPANYQSIRLGNPSGSVTAPVDVQVTLPPGATLRDVKYQDADDAEDLGSDVDMDRAPDGSVQFIVPDFRLAANSYGHVQFNYDLGATLGPQLFGVTMLDPTTGKELTSRTDLSGAWDISDGQEPNSPFEARYNPIPNAATTPLTTDSRIPNLPTNPAGCSSSNDTCAGLDRVYVDVLASGHISYAGDVDWFRVKGVKAGTRLTADLTNLPLDADLVLYGPATLAASPSLFPKNAVGLPGQLIEDPGLAIGQSASSLAVSALAGLRLDQGYTEPSSGGVFAALTPLSISQHRGAENEAVGTIAPVDGDYVVQVSGHNTETAINPYVLRVRGFTPDDPMFCSARTFPHAAPPAGAAPAVGTDVNTIFLTNPSRLAATHGQDAADGIAGELQATVDYLNADTTKGLKAAVVPVDAYAAVQEAYDAWDANPCSVPGANGVTAAITGVLAGLRSAGNDLDYVTLVGGDDLLPMGRVADLTRVGNESEYASTFQGAPNPLAASSTGGFTLTDDPYGDPSPTSMGNGNSLFVPQISVGRLVETPAEITGALTAYRSAAGVLDTHTALVSGYDFLSDGALSAAERLKTGGHTVDRSLIDEPGTSTPWTSAALLGKLFPSGEATPMLASVNAHYDHQALLSSAGDAGDGSDLVTAAQVAEKARLGGAEKLAGRVLFTMGCHAGLAVPDAYVGGAGAATAGDWAQTLAEAKVAVYVANTGYGIGDSSSVAYTERLMALYAKLLDGSLTAGQALTYAKQAYYGSLGAVGVYDTKILQQSTFYGLPFWEVSTNATQPSTSSTAARSSAAVEPTTDPTLGLQAPFTMTPTLTEVTTADGRFWTADGMDPQVTHYQPTQPKTTLSVTATGKLAHGALISSLTSHDVTGVRPVVTTPVVDTTAAAPSVRSDDAAWPASIANITTWHSPEGLAQDLVLMPGQFTGSTHDGTGVQRLFDRVGASVLYRDPSDTDFTAPTVTQATGKPNAGVMTFSVTTIDPTPNGSVQLVRVGYQGASGAWLFTDLARDSEDPTLWTGSGVHPGATSTVPFFVQAVDASGNVGVANGKVGGFFASGDTTPPTITASVDPAPNAAGWIKAPKATVTFTCSDSESGVAETACPEPVDVTVDGGTTVTGTVRDRAGNNASTSVAVQLDNTPPVLVATVAPAGWTNAESATVTFTCSDPASGLVGACPDPVTATAEGSTSVERTITDVAGNSTTVSRDLRIDRTAPTVTIEGSGSALTCRTTDALSGVATSATGAHTVIPSGSYFVCTGAMDNAGNSAEARRQTAGPISFAWTNGASAAPTLTTATRGENIVVRFRLTRDGGDLTDPSMVTGIAVRTVACSPWGQPAQPWESVMGANSVKYNAKERSFQFGWKTPKVTSCYEFRISLIDETSQIARFRLG